MRRGSPVSTVPVIDISPLRTGGDVGAVASALDTACRDTGFFCIVGHGVDIALMAQLDRSARTFFALPEATKAGIAMSAGGRAWRGWFPLGGEVTNGIPDGKEGLYFGDELGEDDRRVAIGTPLHGRNLFPPDVPELRTAVLAWIDALTTLGHVMMGGIAVGLGLPQDWFRKHLTSDPTVLLRVFRYPPTAATVGGPNGPDGPDGPDGWGVAEHTDYGLLTLLMQDDCGGLQVKGRSGWVEAEPILDSFVCNIGDMLERMTGGRYRSTPHRVRNTSGRDRLSFPFFFDPSWDARVTPIGLAPEESSVEDDPRWDGHSVFDFDGTYGEYLVAKVTKVFPDLFHAI